MYLSIYVYLDASECCPVCTFIPFTAGHSWPPFTIPTWIFMRYVVKHSDVAVAIIQRPAFVEYETLFLPRQTELRWI